MKINMPKGASTIIDRLEKAGYEAYIVGGCVRDSILGKEPHDWDITTSATPEQVESVFKDSKIIETGLKHGTITIGADGDFYEVTTYRIDGKYTDGRRPDSVEFTSSLKEDLARRDFTINAMAYNDKDGIIDYFNGMADLKNKRIKCVGNAIARFKEDGLRILRAIRFSARLGFDIDSITMKAAIKCKENLMHVSSERVYEEVCKIVMSNNPEKISLIEDMNLSQCHETLWYFRNIRDLSTMKNTDNFKARMMILFSNLGGIRDSSRVYYGGAVDVVVKEAMETFKSSCDETNSISKGVSEINKWRMVTCHDTALFKYPSKVYIKEMRNRCGSELFDIVMKALLAMGLVESDDFQKITYGAYHDPIFMKEIAIDGTDVMSFGFKGAQIGVILKEVQQMVWRFPAKNTRDDIMEYIEDVFG